MLANDRDSWFIGLVMISPLVLLLPAVGFAQYNVTPITVAGVMEYRMELNGFHFGTVLDDGGTFVFRPRPHDDPNGFGTSWFAQPFLPGAVLGHTTISGVTAGPGGISVSASGSVSRNASDTFGTWNQSWDVQYDRPLRKVTGAGTYQVSLDSALTPSTGDLNLFKIASNFLDDVPLVSGGIGDTGDMSVAVVTNAFGQSTWNPPAQPSHFPGPPSDFLTMDVLGEFNEVDTLAQGFGFAIVPALKPSLQVTLQSQQPGGAMIFGGVFDVAKGQDFFADNIGITPLILVGESATSFSYLVDFESTAPVRNVPEPAGAVLAALGLLSFGIRPHRKR